MSQITIWITTGWRGRGEERPWEGWFDDDDDDDDDVCKVEKYGNHNKYYYNLMVRIKSKLQLLLLY